METLFVRAKKSFTCHGEMPYDAEMLVSNEGKQLYLHYNSSFGFEHFTVADFSFFDYITGETDETPGTDYLECYDTLRQAKASAYYKAFATLRKLVKQMMVLEEDSSNG